MRTSITKHIENPFLFKKKLLYWSQQFREVVYMDSNNYPQKYSSYDCIVAIDAFTAIKTDYHDAFDQIDHYQKITKDWLFGYFSYDLKNDIESLNSDNFDGLEFPDLFFFQPKKIFLLKEKQLQIKYLSLCDDEIEVDFQNISSLIIDDIQSNNANKIEIKQRISEEKYLEKVELLLKSIHLGDIYEANFCLEFFLENCTLNPFEKFLKLNKISKSPQAVFFRNNKHFLLSASPERYIRKQANTIISQPIKGTSKRYLDANNDFNSKEQLRFDSKERSENIMVTDLVRNDLSKTASKGSVYVEELCEIYSFEQVHQMISTITSTIDDQFSPVDVIRTTFPMASMTGVPKISVMKMIEAVEETKRGLYSGALGYFTPDGDFDFNVVIRSILYNQEKMYASFSVGSAITSRSNPEKEYQECLLKAKAMKEVLS